MTNPHIHVSRPCGFAATVLVAVVAAHTTGRTQAPGDAETGAMPAAALQDAFTVPIHTAAPDRGRAYGIWASGPDYKVSFHDGVAFYPVLGPDYPNNLPLRWRTTSIAIDGDELRDSDDTTVHATDWRYELRSGLVTEAYDVRPDGVEQTFVLHDKPAMDGDLIVTGRIETALLADPTGRPRSGPLVFRDDAGRPIIRYGRALAFDADGRTSAITTSFDGERIQLHVARDWLRDASYPVTVDPLLAAIPLALTGTVVNAPQVACSVDIGESCVTYHRRVSAADSDAYVRLVDDQWGNPAIVFSDVTATWSTTDMTAAFARAPQRWLVAFTRTFGGPSSGLRYHLHNALDRTISTSVRWLPRSATREHESRPAVGGNYGRDTDEVLLTYEVDRALTAQRTTTTELWGVVVDCRNNVVSTPVRVDRGGSAFDNEHASVSHHYSGGAWIVTYQDYRNGIAQSSWKAVMTRVDINGQVRGPYHIGDTSANVHQFLPKVAGIDHRTAVSYAQRAGSGHAAAMVGDAIFVQRVDWPAGAPRPSLGAATVLRTGSDLRNCGIAYDWGSTSHWAVLSREGTGQTTTYADRIGYNLGVAESVQLAPVSVGAEPSVAFLWRRKNFRIVYGSGPTVFGLTFAYPQAGTSIYGTGCGTAKISTSTGHRSQPYAGARGFYVGVHNAPRNTSAVLMLGAAPGALGLDSLGMPGCVLNLDPGQIFAQIPQNLSGHAGAWVLPIPAPASGTVYTQLLYVDPGANPANLGATEGMRIDVR